MNLYFVLEGETTETLIYPRWINYIYQITHKLILRVKLIKKYLLEGARKRTKTLHFFVTVGEHPHLN
jgi:hypothetical protein